MKNLLTLCLATVVVGCTTSVNTPVASPATVSPPVANEIESKTQPPQNATGEVTETETKTVKQSFQSTVEEQSPTEESFNHLDLLNQLLFSTSTEEEVQEILTKIEASGDTRFVAGLIDVLRYQRGLQIEIGNTLNALTEQNLPPDWFEWVEWAGQHPEIKSFDGYVGFKANLFSRIDPNFLRFVYEGVKVAPDSRPEEIVWGGVLVDGIPALDNPNMIDPAEADYLIPEERVFGVTINGDTRAYPARFLDWHEMFNDVVGGEPVSLAY